jgi:hypothetical protein
MQVFERLGRSRRDRGAELLDDLLARVADTRTAAKYDLDVAHFAKTRWKSFLELCNTICHYRKLVIGANDLTEPAPLDGVA